MIRSIDCPCCGDIATLETKLRKQANFEKVNEYCFKCNNCGEKYYSKCNNGKEKFAAIEKCSAVTY